MSCPEEMGFDHSGHVAAPETPPRNTGPVIHQSAAMSATAHVRPSLIEQSLLGAVALGVVAMLSLPAARAGSETFGWLPFWLLALPLSAWAVARLLRLRDQRAWAMARPMASVHALHGVRPRTVMVRTLPRAA